LRRTARTPTLRLLAWLRCTAGEGEEGGSEEEGSEEEEEGEGRELDPEAAARVRAEVQRLLEEYYKLNYEDVVGGVPTRFR
jgi:protein KRI1